MSVMNELVRVIEKMNPDTDNGAIIFHMEKGTLNVKTISPLVKATNVPDMLVQLMQVRDAIDSMINDINNKLMKDNGRAN